MASIRQRRSHRFGICTLVLASALAAASWVATGTAQSPNPFGAPSADKPQPGSTINAVPGSRAQGWLGRDARKCSPDTASSRRAIRWRRKPGSRSCARAATPSTRPSRPAPCSMSRRRTTPASAAISSRSSGRQRQEALRAELRRVGAGGMDAGVLHRQARLKSVPNSGVNSATVPGAISGYDALLKRFGTLTFKETFERAARIADEGWGQAERRHVGSARRRQRPARRSRFEAAVPRRRSGAAALQHHPQSRPGQGAAPDPEAGPRRLLQGRDRRRDRRQGAGQRRRDDRDRSGGVPVGMGRADLDQLPRLRRLRAAAAGTGFCRARDAEHPRGVRAEARVQPRDAGSVRSDVLASDGRSEEARLRRSAREERRSEVRERAGRPSCSRRPTRRRCAARSIRTWPSSRRRRRHRRRHDLPDDRRSLGQHGVADPQRVQRLRQPRHRRARTASCCTTAARRSRSIRRARTSSRRASGRSTRSSPAS